MLSWALCVTFKVGSYRQCCLYFIHWNIHCWGPETLWTLWNSSHMEGAGTGSLIGLQIVLAEGPSLLANESSVSTEASRSITRAFELSWCHRPQSTDRLSLLCPARTDDLQTLWGLKINGCFKPQIGVICCV